jgi:glycine/D-amino acid oxidase-like deaminating enzyme
LPLADVPRPPAVYDTGASPPPTTRLTSPLRVAVAVVGAGFTGLSAAVHLAQAGIAVAVLEARTIGWGASGRAFGQVVPYLKISHTEVLRHYGPERGLRVIDAIAAGPDLVFDLIGAHGIDCWAVRTGLIFAAHAPAGQRDLERRTAYWRNRGAPVAMLAGTCCAEAIGSTLYRCAAIDRRGGHLNPLAYLRGLAWAAMRAGATIYTGTEVCRLVRRDRTWIVQTGAAAVTTEVVVLATNAYTTVLWPGLRESIIPVRGHGFVTAPISDNVRGSILPGGQSLTDTRRLFSGIRLLPDGRLHASAYGPVSGSERPPDFRRVDARVRRLYPQLAKPLWQEGWSGFVAMTRDHVPRMHELAPGLYAGLGYNGRGIAAATLMGRELAARVRGRNERESVFPLVPLRPLRWHRFAPALAGLLAQWYRVRDASDELRLGSLR